jgi:hypothetical protein
MGLTLAIILSGCLCHLLFWRRLKGLVVFPIKAKCHFCLDPSLEAGIKGEVILSLAYSSMYLQTQSSLEEHTFVVMGDVSNLADSDDIGAKGRNGLIGALLHRAKLMKGRVSAVLSEGHPAIEEVLHNHPGLIAI